MNFPNEVSCSILIDPRDLGNVIGGKNSIDPRDLTVLPDGFHPLGYGFVADVMMEFASARRAAREDGIDGPGWAERLDDGLSGLVKALRDRSGWSPGHPFDANAFHAGEGPRDERLVCRDLDGFADAGELAEENARLYGAPSVADLAETVWGCTSLEPVKVRHPGTVPDRLIDNFIPAMKRCDVSGGGPTPGTEDAPEGATVRATRPGDINISFPALAERAQAAALATARGATTAAGNRL